MHIVHESHQSDWHHLIEQFENWKKRITQFLLRFGRATGQVVTVSTGVKGQLRQMIRLNRSFLNYAVKEDLLAPALKTPMITAVLAKEGVEYVVLLPDWRIADLPLEGMKTFQAQKLKISSAPSLVLAETSIHMIGHRLNSYALLGGQASMTNPTFMVDPLLEDNPKKEDEEKTDKNIDAKDVEMPLGITQTFAMIKEGNWNGLVGDEHVPSVSEWQQL